MERISNIIDSRDEGSRIGSWLLQPSTNIARETGDVSKAQPLFNAKASPEGPRIADNLAPANFGYCEVCKVARIDHESIKFIDAFSQLNGSVMRLPLQLSIGRPFLCLRHGISQAPVTHRLFPQFPTKRPAHQVAAPILLPPA